MRKTISDSKIVLEKQMWGLVGVVFGGLGVLMFHNHEALAPRILVWVIFLIGCLDFMRYYKVEFNKETKTYSLFKGWRFINERATQKQGFFGDFSSILIELVGPAQQPRSNLYAFLEYKKGGRFVPHLSSAFMTMVSHFSRELDTFARFFDLKIKLLNIPDSHKHYFAQLPLAESSKENPAVKI